MTNRCTVNVKMMKKNEIERAGAFDPSREACHEVHAFGETST